MAGGEVKGSVTPLDSDFSPADAQKAAARVQDSIADKKKELARLQVFVSDNTNLINLVQRLPDELSHDIMVPFGGAAFFPGKLIHTNEFLVLLGEGYYADRTARQTVEILKRRGKSLESQVESLKAVMMDLEAEAKFFNSTASEAAEGFVDIREEYVEELNKNKPESDSNGASTSDNPTISTADDEYARIMARLDELEKEELEQGSDSGADEELGESEISAPVEYDSSSDEDEKFEATAAFSKYQQYLKNKGNEILQKNKLENTLQDSNNEESSRSASGKPIGGNLQQHVKEQSPLFHSSISVKDGSSASKAEDAHVTAQKHHLLLDPKENLRKASNPNIENSSSNVGKQTSQTGFSARRAFTGSIVEHDDANPPIQSTKSSSNQSTGLNPAKPVSRFKMQKGNH
ncbi:hypothetical protein J5N97_022128 [Dioscorea zingiberensis]|uniref:RNA polymerase II subunit 5-mediating protein homolog n=1 Tax=Dioscorea zingiberensis TaxID=325984 RepID=A0A9D5C9Z4_9LILI|nr:hypothetical protein J5N97_022128 [Dioscorea zingiberensis]